MNLEKFFDRVNRDILMSRLGKRIKDKVAAHLPYLLPFPSNQSRLPSKSAFLTLPPGLVFLDGTGLFDTQ
jgi:hypothetical protein